MRLPHKALENGSECSPQAITSCAVRSVGQKWELKIIAFVMYLSCNGSLATSGDGY
jgi:hypothetical protein